MTKKLIFKATFQSNKIEVEPTNHFPGKIETISGKKYAEDLIASFSVMMGTFKTDAAEVMSESPEGRIAVTALRDGNVINVYKDIIDHK